MDRQAVTTQTNVETRKALAKSYLNDNRLDEAIELYAEILRDFPNDVESLVTLGNLYLAGGEGKSARLLYHKALQLDPNNQVIKYQLQLTGGELLQDPPDLFPTNPIAVANLIEQLSGSRKEKEENDLVRAATLLETIVKSDNPAEMVSRHYDEINELLPVLVEINLRQAVNDGKTELADALQTLKQNVIQEKLKEESQEALLPAVEPEVIPQSPAQSKRVLLFKLTSGPLSDRLLMAQAALEKIGCEIQIRSNFQPTRDPRPDLAIVSNPQTNPKVLESLATLSALSVPIIVDLDDNFEQLPISHPNYLNSGLGTLAQSKAYNTGLLLANLITVNSEAIAASLSSKGYKTQIIPDGWSNKNPFWLAPSEPRGTINLGWVSSAGQLEDLALIRRVVARILREFSNVQIVIIGDGQAYRLFESIPENRRIFFPLMSPQEYPHQLSQVDILMAPLRNDPYHMSLSDKVIIEAGVKGIPWIASPNPAFIQWQAGGLIANTQDEWYLYLRQLVMSADIRQNFSQSGRMASKSREMERLSEHWIQAVEQVALSEPEAEANTP
jgi:tetratricopeptide (TPR) repeat protein